MRYKEVIILRVTDFSRFFNFADFWAYRNMYRETTGRLGFWNQSSQFDKKFQYVHCHNIVEKWISNTRIFYTLQNDTLYYNNEPVGKYSANLVNSVSGFLNEYPDLRHKANCELFLLSLYSIIDSDYNIDKFESDKKDIAKILLNDSSDFTKEYVEFHDNSREMHVSLKCHDLETISEGKNPYNELKDGVDCSIHITLIKNQSSNFAVYFTKAETEQILFKIEPENIALALFDQNGRFIEVVPNKGEVKRFSTKGILKLEESQGRVNLRYTEDNYERCHEDIISWSYDADGYFFVTNDKYQPVHCFHPEFDHDIIKERLEWELEQDEYPIYVKSRNGILLIRTNKRLIKL